MVTLLITGLLALIVGILAKMRLISHEACCTWITLILLWGTLFGVFVPLAPYQEPVLTSTTELFPINYALASTDAVQDYYLSVKIEDSNVSYTYCVRDDNQKFISNHDTYYYLAMPLLNDVIIISKEIDTPTLEFYEQKRQPSLWSFQLGESRRDFYQFIVPEDKIAYTHS